MFGVVMALVGMGWVQHNFPQKVIRIEVGWGVSIFHG